MIMFCCNAIYIYLILLQILLKNVLLLFQCMPHSLKYMYLQYLHLTIIIQCVFIGYLNVGL